MLTEQKTLLDNTGTVCYNLLCKKNTLYRFATSH